MRFAHLLVSSYGQVFLDDDCHSSVEPRAGWTRDVSDDL